MDHTICYFRGNGAVSMYYRTTSLCDGDAIRQAESQMRPEFTGSEIWKDYAGMEVLIANRCPAAGGPRDDERRKSATQA